MQDQAEALAVGTLERQLSAVLPDANCSLGIPPACYADDGLLALERLPFF